MIAIAVAAAMESMQHLKPELVTKGHQATGMLGFNGLGRNKTKNHRKNITSQKSHQGKQECAGIQHSACWGVESGRVLHAGSDLHAADLG